MKQHIVTPIYYANGLPHIGHFTTTLVADTLARYYRKKLGKDNIFFTTGLDEHGTTVEQAAIKEGYDKDHIKDYTDTRAKQWEKAFQETQISYDYFVRTTNPKHKKFAQEFIKKMVDKGDVYKDTYKGKYCNGCEKFLTLSDLNEEGYCPLHRPDQVVETEEENYFFKLSKYAPEVKKLIESGEINITPKAKANEMLARIDQGVEDLSISRPKDKVSWGVEFPDDNKQVVYVWVEALINYLSSLKINNKETFANYTTNILAKDINWFHNVIWPAFLLSAEYPLYKNSYVHSFLNVSGQKISKSLGNMITPQELIQKYGIDGARYLTWANLPHKQDSDVTWELLDEKYNADLANALGNTVSRVAKLAQNSGLEFENNEKDTEKLFDRDWAQYLEKFELDRVLPAIWKIISNLEKHINENEPWAIKDDENKLREVLEHEVNEIRVLAQVIEPFLPTTAQKIQKQFSTSKITSEQGLFPRV